MDSSGWLEYLANGPNAGVFAKPLAHPSRVIVPTIVIHEVVKTFWRERGEEAAFEVAGIMQDARVVPLDETLAIAAAGLGLEKHLAMADSIILATARAHQAPLWTQDADFKGMDGVQYIAHRRS